MPLYKILDLVFVYKSINYFFCKVTHDLNGRKYIIINKPINLKY